MGQPAGFDRGKVNVVVLSLDGSRGRSAMGLAGEAGVLGGARRRQGGAEAARYDWDSPEPRAEAVGRTGLEEAAGHGVRWS